MKKLLALVLALVMTLSLATVSTNAAFDDADNIEYTEAVEVMNAIGVLEGDGTGNFNPKGILNREQAAKILSIVVLGKSMANKLSVSEIKFADVKATDWAASYIAYCAANGIVVGDGTNFYPKAELTGHAFAKMLLVALGADGTYTGADWAINVAVDAQSYKLTSGLSGVVLSDPLTREQAAQMALNALNYTNKSTSYKVTLGKDEYTFDNMKDALLYKALLGTEATVAPVPASDTILAKTFKVTRDTADIDNFGRPATTYKNASGSVNLIYVDEPTFTYAGENFKTSLWDKNGELYDRAIDEAVVMHNGTKLDKIDGVIGKNQRVGAEVEVYTDAYGDVTKVVVAQAIPFQVTKSTSKGVTYVTATPLYKADDVKEFKADSKDASNTTEGAIYAKLSGYKNNAIVAGYVKGTDTLLKVVDLETVEGEVTSRGAAFVKIDGVKYLYAHKSAYKADLEDEGTFYLLNGTVVYFAGTKVTSDVDDLVYIVKPFSLTTGKGEKDAWGNDIGETTHKYAQVVYLDGTTAVIEYNNGADDDAVDKGLMAIESVDSKGIYKLTTSEKWLKGNNYKIDTISAKTGDEATKLNQSKVKGNAYTVRLNSETQNVITNGKDEDDLAVTTSTGIANVSLKADAIVIGTASGKNLTAAYVIISDSQVEVLGDLIYLVGNTNEDHNIVNSDNVKVPCFVWAAYDMEGEVVYLDIAKATNTRNYFGWGTYTTTDGIATFASDKSGWNDTKLTGVLNSVEIVKNGFYDGYLLTAADDLDTEDAIVINLVEDVTCNDIDTVISLANAGYTITADIASDGETVVIVITNIE